MKKPLDLRVLVIGGGLNGLSTAWQLSRMGVKEVTLLERFQVGHERGSSHGKSRICRSTYGSSVYVELLRAARTEDWPRLECDSGRKLLIPCDGCFMGPAGGLYQEFSETMESFEDEVDILSPAEGARRFPQFNFTGMAGAIDDRTAAVIAAEETLRALADLCRANGVTIREQTTVQGIDGDGSPLTVRTDRGNLESDRVVVTAGPWSQTLLPFLSRNLTAVRQNIGFFNLRGTGGYGPENFPVWAYLGKDQNDFYYGLPEFGREGVKAAQHIVSDAPDNPDLEKPPSEEVLVGLRSFVERLFTFPVDTMVHSETCFYTNTEDEDFILDLHPQNPNIVFGAGFSGHGFKFGPLTGRILAELAIGGSSSVAEFNTHREALAFTPIPE